MSVGRVRLVAIFGKETDCESVNLTLFTLMFVEICLSGMYCLFQTDTSRRLMNYNARRLCRL